MRPICRVEPSESEHSTFSPVSDRQSGGVTAAGEDEGGEDEGGIVNRSVSSMCGDPETTGACVGG